MLGWGGGRMWVVTRGVIFPPCTSCKSLPLSSQFQFTLTINLHINKPWTDNQIIAIDLHISLDLFFPKYLSWVNDFSITHPKIVYDYFAVSKQAAIPELIQLWLKVASSFHGEIYKDKRGPKRGDVQSVHYNNPEQPADISELAPLQQSVILIDSKIKHFRAQR